MEYKIILFKAETPIHMGGNQKLGIVDNPIQREIHTNFPKLPASGIKGSIRNEFDEEIADIIFGDEINEKHRSIYSFVDGRILFFPVKSAKNIYTWVTCPYVLNRFFEDYTMFLGESFDEGVEFQPNTFLMQSGNELTNLILEEITFKVNVDGAKKEKNKKEEKGKKEEKDKKDKKYKSKDLFLQLLKDIVYKNEQEPTHDIFIISDNDFRYFVELSTEVNTRIKIGDNGIVENGKLFTEEYVPEETIFYGFVGADNKAVEQLLKREDLNEKAIKKIKKIKHKPFKKLNKELQISNSDFKTGLIQLGGNSTLGKGFTSVKITEIKESGGKNDNVKSG